LIVVTIRNPDELSVTTHQAIIVVRRIINTARGRAAFIKGLTIDEPLSRVVLEQLELDPCVEEIISRLESESGNLKLNQIRERQQISYLEKEIEKWKALLPCCVDVTTGQVDREKENYYWERIHEAAGRLEELRSRPVITGNMALLDYSGLRDFLKSLPEKWYSLSGSLRNRFLKSLISRVELRGEDVLEATIYWKTGFQQKVLIQPGHSRRLREKIWTKEENCSLMQLFPSSSREEIQTRLPARSWKSITLRANRLKIRRKRVPGRSQSSGWNIENGANLLSGQGTRNLKFFQELPSGRLRGILPRNRELGTH
jgi:hypothetical protein